MTRDEVVALFAGRQEAWDVRDAGKLAATHSEHGIVVSPMFTTVRGRTDIRGAYQSLFRIFPDWTYTPEQLLVDGDRVAQSFAATATHMGEFMGLEGSGRRCVIHGVLLFRLEGGLIAEERRFYDFTGLLVQIGILRTKPAKTP